eukprot:g33115.t1
MLKSKSFVKKTRSGGVLKVVREHYLRDDILCGWAPCEECGSRGRCPSPGQNPTPSGLTDNPHTDSQLCPRPHYLLPDTNVVLHQ